jgi:hypothetical protein
MNAAVDHVTKVLVMQIIQCGLTKVGIGETVMLLLILGRAIRPLKLSSWCDLLLYLNFDCLLFDVEVAVSLPAK